jgi:peroxiredoxin (alkyl hydroperoxide reductase subunit C)
MINIDEQIPELNVEAYQNDEIINLNLGDFKGKWLVMLFYPADFTFVCPTELEEAAAYYDAFKEENAEIISVSTDTAFVHKAWHDNSKAINKIQYPMVADPNNTVCKAFGTLIAEEGVSRRASFIIDPDGKVISYEIHSNDIGRNIREILRKLQAAKFVRESDGLVCPASWEPGKDTLKPGMDLVGKI